jgi:hypothetical protein
MEDVFRERVRVMISCTQGRSTQEEQGRCVVKCATIETCVCIKSKMYHWETDISIYASRAKQERFSSKAKAQQATLRSSDSLNQIHLTFTREDKK